MSQDTPPQPQEEDELDELVQGILGMGAMTQDNLASMEDAELAAKERLLEWRNTYAKAYAKKVGLQAIGENVGQDWQLTPPPPANVVNVDGSVDHQLHHAVHQASAREGVNQEKAEQRHRLLSILEETHETLLSYLP